jgi:hypothetical protein
VNGGPSLPTPRDSEIESALIELTAEEREAVEALANKTILSGPIFQSSKPLQKRAWMVAIAEAKRTRIGSSKPGTLSDGPPVSKPATVAVVTRMSEIEARAVEWLWEGRIPVGMLTLFEGDPGVGKSTTLYDVVARVTRGWAMPSELGSETSGIVREPRTVLLLSAEDDPHAVIRPRLDAAGADVERVIILKMQTEDGTREPLITEQDVAAWVEVVREHAVALVVVDPIVAYLPDGTDTNNDHSIRRALGRLKPLAESGCSVIGVKHWRKGASDKALYRGGGSIGFVGAARSVLVAGHDPDDESRERRVFAVVKSNLAAIAPSLGYRLAVSAGAAVPHVEWLGVVEHGADALSAMPPTGEERSALADAREFLREVLADGELRQKDVQRQAKAREIKEATLRRAVKAEKVASRREGFGAEGYWLWALRSGGGVQ